MSVPKEINFDLKQIRTFLELVREKSFTRASRNLHIGQASISNHLSALEKTLGVELVHRSSKEFSVTPEGEVFRRYCESLLGGVDTLLDEMKARSSETSARIASSTIPSAYILPAAIAAVRKRRPGLYYSIEVSDSREVTEMVREGRAELGVVGRMLKNPLMRHEIIGRDRLVLVGPAALGLDEIDAADIAGLDMVTRQKGSGTRDAYEKILSAGKIAPSGLKIVMECSTTDAVREAVAAGMGVAFLSELAVRQDLETGRLREIRVRGLQTTRDFYLVYIKSRKLSLPALMLREELAKNAAGVKRPKTSG